jgi:small subunit ribosomal protein S12e
MEALKEVMKLSLHADSLARGLYESVKALDRGTAQLCILSQSCNEQAYKKLIQALCKERGIPLVEVPDNKIIGESAGLARLRADGTIAKHIGCSCAVVKSWGVDSDARAVVLDTLKTTSLFK